jgi:hypothetical protein
MLLTRPTVAGGGVPTMARPRPKEVVMKDIPLQLMTVIMEDGQQGIFIGVPMVADAPPQNKNHISEIWFSDVREIPNSLTVSVLMEMVQAQLCQSQGKVH